MNNFESNTDTLQEFTGNFSFFELNGSLAEKHKDKHGFNEIDIDTEKEKGPKKDSEKIACSKEVSVIKLAEEQIEIVEISDDDDNGNTCSSSDNPFFNFCFEILAK